MAETSSTHLPSWTVAVTRDEPDTGPLHVALRRLGFVPASCVVLEESPPADPDRLRRVSATLDQYSWVIFASARAVRALQRARAAPWPRGLRTAAVGEATAEALAQAGAHPPPMVASEPGAQALCARLLTLEAWAGRRVLVPGVEGGRRDIIDGLTRAGAVVDEIEAYRMQARSGRDIQEAWSRAEPDAAVIVSPSVGDTLVKAVGIPALSGLRAIVAMGATTADALARHGLRAATPLAGRFESVASRLADLRAGA